NPCLLERGEQRTQCFTLIDRDDVGAGDHDVLNAQPAKPEEPQHHAALFGAERVISLGFGLQRILERIAQSLSARQPKSRLEACESAFTSVSGMLAVSRWVDVDAHNRRLALMLRSEMGRHTGRGRQSAEG